jgi:hypothetical protein
VWEKFQKKNKKRNQVGSGQKIKFQKKKKTRIRAEKRQTKKVNLGWHRDRTHPSTLVHWFTLALFFDSYCMGYWHIFIGVILCQGLVHIFMPMSPWCKITSIKMVYKLMPKMNDMLRFAKNSAAIPFHLKYS